MKNDKWLRICSIILTWIGILDAFYLTYVKYTHTEVYCAGSSNCQTVNSSPYAEIYGIPIALLGLLSYLALLFLLYSENISINWKEITLYVAFGITFIGVLFSVYLTYIEIAIIKALCPYCVISAVVLLFLFLLTIMRLLPGLTQGEKKIRR